MIALENHLFTLTVFAFKRCFLSKATLSQSHQCSRFVLNKIFLISQCFSYTDMRLNGGLLLLRLILLRQKPCSIGASQVNSNMSVLFHTTSGKITAQTGMSLIAVCNLFAVLLIYFDHIRYLFANFLSEITACCSYPI